jgi:hypothetical protein
MTMSTSRTTGPVGEVVSPARRRDVAANLCGPLVLLLVLLVLPHAKYLRYLEMNGGDTVRKTLWAYERIHDVARPIDVAFVGSSRTMLAVDDGTLESVLADGFGRRLGVANLAVAWEGRNQQYLLAKELLSTQACRVLVLEVMERESRFSHPYFRYLADSGDVLRAPLLLNRNYLKDLAYLPHRNLELLALTARARLAGAGASLVPPRPESAHHPVLTDLDRSASFMQEARRKEDAREMAHYLPDNLDWLEFRYPRAYLRRIADLADRHGVKLVLLYMPRFGRLVPPHDLDRYLELGPVWTPPAGIIVDPGNWADATHMNGRGNGATTSWLAERLGAWEGLGTLGR